MAVGSCVLAVRVKVKTPMTLATTQEANGPRVVSQRRPITSLTSLFQNNFINIEVRLIGPQSLAMHINVIHRTC